MISHPTTQPNDRLDSRYMKQKKKFIAHRVPNGDTTKMMVVFRRDGTKFLLGKTPVTVGEYREFCKATGTKDPCPKSDPLHPVTNISVLDAEVYCTWAGLRLPSEEEWEFAATGGDGRKFPWGNEPPTESTCWYSGNKNRRYGPDGVSNRPKGASPFGCLDMSGNVWEWTSSLWEPNSPYCVVRGGSWSYSSVDFVRAAFRYWGVPSYRVVDFGFRCARDYQRKVKP